MSNIYNELAAALGPLQADTSMDYDERIARAICVAWQIRPDEQYDDPLDSGGPFKKPRTVVGWQLDSVQRFAWAFMACQLIKPTPA
jgi:hypothetical protein